MNVVFLGATRGVGRAMARAMASRGDRLFLLGRDEAELARSGRDLEARERLLAQQGGTLCVFSSVAGERGRKPVVLYGAAKAGLTRYLEGLDHRFRARGLRVVCVKPGFVRTSMTEGLPEPPFAADPEQVAEIALAAIDRGTPVVYAPGIWRWVMLVIRNLPRFVMRRVGF
jgi:short-subunit dehydrogenase